MAGLSRLSTPATLQDGRPAASFAGTKLSPCRAHEHSMRRTMWIAGTSPAMTPSSCPGIPHNPDPDDQQQARQEPLVRSYRRPIEPQKRACSQHPKSFERLPRAHAMTDGARDPVSVDAFRAPLRSPRPPLPEGMTRTPSRSPKMRSPGAIRTPSISMLTRKSITFPRGP
jgi:hypothetical protein